MNDRLTKLTRLIKLTTLTGLAGYGRIESQGRIDGLKGFIGLIWLIRDWLDDNFHQYGIDTKSIYTNLWIERALE